jgi:hypothetical protein
MDIFVFNKNILPSRGKANRGTREQGVKIMLKKPVFMVGLTILTFLTFSCYTQKIVKLDEIKNNRGKILAVVTITGEWIEFPIPGKIIDGEIVYQAIEEGKKTMKSIPLREVKRVWLKKFSTKFLLQSLIVLPVLSFLTYMIVRDSTH